MQYLCFQNRAILDKTFRFKKFVRILDKPIKSCCDLSKCTSLKIVCTSLRKYPCFQNREILIYTTQFFGPFFFFEKSHDFAMWCKAPSIEEVYTITQNRSVYQSEQLWKSHVVLFSQKIERFCLNRAICDRFIIFVCM